MNDQRNKKKEPLFIPKENGSGWNLNFSNPLSYWILAIILIFPFAVAVYAVILARK